MVSLTGAKIQVVIGADSSQAQKEMSSFGDRIQTFGRNSAISGALLSLGLTAPIVALGKAALTTGAQFQESLNVFQATTQANAAQMSAISKEAIQLGADLTLPKTSANDAALAMTELAKAGLSVDDVMAAAKGTLELAAAGQLNEADAARITANELNAFHLAGSQAVTIADLLAAAANASSAEVADLASSSTYLAPIWYEAGQSAQTMIAALAEMANAGIRGSTAGTSLRQMMVSLLAPTDKAKTEMETLGINIYDAQGKMKPFPGIIDTFTKAMKGMSDEQKNAALKAIFTTRGLAAANEVLLQGTDEWNKNYTAVTRAGAAADLANARMKGLGGALEALKSQLQTVLLEAVLPFLDGVQRFVRGLAGIVPLFLKIPQPVLKAAVAFAAVLAALGPLLLLFATLTVTLGAFLDGPLVPVILGVAALASVLAGSKTASRIFTDAIITAKEALQGNWVDNASKILLIDRIVGVVATSLRETFVTAIHTAHDAIVTFKEALSGDWTDSSKILLLDRIFGDLGTVMHFVVQAMKDIADNGRIASGSLLGYSGIVHTVVMALNDLWNIGSQVVGIIGSIAGQVTGIINKLGGFWRVLGTGVLLFLGLKGGIAGLALTFGSLLLPVLGLASGGVGKLIPAFSGLHDIFSGMIGAVTGLGGLFGGLGSAISAIGPIFSGFAGSVGIILSLLGQGGIGKAFTGLISIVSLFSQRSLPLLFNAIKLVFSPVQFMSGLFKALDSVFFNLINTTRGGLGLFDALRLAVTKLGLGWRFLTQDLGLAFGALRDVLSGGLTEAIGAIGTALGTIAGAGYEILIAALSKIGFMAGHLGAVLYNVLIPALENVGTFIGTVGRLAVGLGSGALETLSGAFGSLFETLLPTLTVLATKFGSVARIADGLFVSALGNVGGAIGTVGRFLITSMLPGLESIGTEVGTFARLVMGIAVPALNGLGTVLGTIGRVGLSGFVGVMRAIGTSVGTVGAALYNELMPVLSALGTAIGTVGGVGMNILRAAMEHIGTVVGTVGRLVANVAVPAFEFLAETFGTISTAVMSVVVPAFEFLSGFFSTISGLVAGFGGVLATIGGSVAEFFTGFTAFFAGFAGVFAALPGLVGTVVDFIVTRFGIVRAFFGEILNTLSPLAGLIKSSIGFITEAFSEIVSIAGTVVEALAPLWAFFSGFVSTVLGPVISILSTVGGAFATLAGVVADVVLPVIATLGGVILTIGAPVIAIGLALSALAGLFFTNWKKILQAVLPAVSILRAAITPFIDTLLKAADILEQGFKADGFKGLEKNIVPALKQAGEAFKGLGSAILNALGAIDWGAIGSALEDGFKKGFALVTGTAIDIGGWILGMLGKIDWGGVATTLGSGFKTAFDGLKSLGGDLIDIGSWITTAVGKINWSAVGAALSQGFSGAVNDIAKGLDLGKLFGSSKITGPGEGLSSIGTQLAPLTAIIDKVKSSISSLADIISSRLAPTFDIWRKSIDQIIQNSGPQLAKLSDQLHTAFVALVPAVEILAEVLGAILFVALNSIAAVLGAVLPSAIQVAVDIISIMLTSVTTLANVVTDVVKVIVDLIHGDWHQAWTDAKQVVIDLATGILTILATLWDGVKALVTGLVQGVIALFESLYHDVVGGSIIPDMVNGIISWISSLPGTVIGLISGMVSSVLDSLGSLVTTGVGKAGDLVSGFIGAITGLAAQALGIFQGVTSTVLGEVQNLVTEIGAKGTAVVQGFVNGITGAFEAISTAVGELLGTVTGAMSGMLTFLKQEGIDAVQGFIDGILSMKDSVAHAIENVISGAGGLLGQVAKHAGSPWPEMITQGIDLVLGLVVGISETTQTAVKASAEMVKAVIDTIQAGFNLAKDLSLGIPNIDLGVIKQLGDMAQAAVNAIAPIATQFSADMTTQLKAMGDAIKGAFDALSAAVSLAQAISNGGVILPTHEMINNLKDMADWVITALSDSANYFGADLLAAASTFGQAMKDAFGGMEEAVKFVQDIAQGGVILPSHDIINRLKDMADWVVRALSDSGAVYNGKLDQAASQFGQAMKDAFSGMAAAVTFVQALQKGSIDLPTHDLVNNLKDMADWVIRALSDSAAFFGPKLIASAQAFGSAMENAFKGMSDAVNFARDLAENGVVVPTEEVIASIVTMASNAVQLMGKAADLIGGTFVSDAQAFGKAIEDTFGGLDAIVKFAQDMTADFALPMQSTIDQLVALAAYAIQELGKAASELQGGLSDNVAKMGTAIKDAFDGLAAVVKFAQDLASGQIYIPFTSFIDQLSAFATYAVQTLGTAGSTISAGMVEGAKTLGNGIKAAFDGMDEIVKFIQDAQALTTVDLPYALVDQLGKFATDLITAFAKAAQQIDGPAEAAALQYINGIKSLFDGLSTILDVIKKASDVTFATNIGTIVEQSTENLVKGLQKANALFDSAAIEQASQYAGSLSQLFQILTPAINGIIALGQITPIQDNLSDIFTRATRAITDAIKAMHVEARNALSEAQALAATMAQLKAVVSQSGITLSFTGATISFGGAAVFGINGTPGSTAASKSGISDTSTSSDLGSGLGSGSGSGIPPGFHYASGGATPAPWVPIIPWGKSTLSEMQSIYSATSPAAKASSITAIFKIDGKEFMGVVDAQYEDELTNTVSLQKVPM